MMKMNPVVKILNEMLETTNPHAIYEGYDIENLLKDIFEFLDIRCELKESYEYLESYKYLAQKHSYLEVFMVLLNNIKDFIPLAFKISGFYSSKQRRNHYRDEMRDEGIECSENEERKLSDEAILKIVKNFEEIRRKGRNKKVFVDYKAIEIFKQKHIGFINFQMNYKDSLKSANDFARAFKENNISKCVLEKYVYEFSENYTINNILHSYSDRSLYRYKLMHLKELRDYVIDAKFYIQHWVMFDEGLKVTNGGDNIEQ